MDKAVHVMLRDPAYLWHACLMAIEAGDEVVAEMRDHRGAAEVVQTVERLWPAQKHIPLVCYAMSLWILSIRNFNCPAKSLGHALAGNA